MSGPALDLICLGRSSVDLYGEQVGGPLETMRSFAKYVGGCATNIAIGAARLGLESGLITRVGDEQMGRFIRGTLEDEGVDVSHVSTDPERLTALVILGIRDSDDIPHIFYRDNCADMALAPEHIDPGFVGSATALLVTGTHFSAPGVEAASRAAMAHARAAGRRVIFDIDYRPVAWGLAGHGAGASRFVASAQVTDHLQSILPSCDLVVGTEEEIRIAGGAADSLAALRAIRERTAAPIVLKRGAEGCIVFPAAIPARLEAGIVGPGFPVEVFNTLGAGDGFMSGFLRGWLRDEPWETCCRLGNGAGALVVSRHGCSPASPSWPELQAFLEHGSPTPRLREDPRLNHLHRVSTRRRAQSEICALAFDHRTQLEALADRCALPRSRIPAFKLLVARALQSAAAGQAHLAAIVDERHGAEVLSRLSDGDGWLARPVEAPGSRPLRFEAGANIALALRSWPAGQIAKCLVHYHPDDPAALRRDQEDSLATLYEACLASGHELLIEVLPGQALPIDDRTLARAMAAIYDRGVLPDWWKLPPPESTGAWREITAVLEARDPHCRGVVLLGLNAAEAELKRGFDLAADQPWCKGFAVGRSIFHDAAEAWFEGRADDDTAVEMIARNYAALVEIWRSRAPIRGS